MTRGDSMISTFDVPPLAEWQGLSDIDSLQSRKKNEKYLKNREVLARRNSTD